MTVEEHKKEADRLFGLLSRKGETAVNGEERIKIREQAVYHTLSRHNNDELKAFLPKFEESARTLKRLLPDDDSIERTIVILNSIIEERNNDC